jgi:mannose-6-phosphate isomerase class I
MTSADIASEKKTSSGLVHNHVQGEVRHYLADPTHSLPNGSLGCGFDELAGQLQEHAAVLLDGYIGVDWRGFRANLDEALQRLGVRPHWVAVHDCMKSAAEIDAMVAPFLGGDDPLFGTRFTGELDDFFDLQRLSSLRPEPREMTIFYGYGAALVTCDGLLVFVDVPKNEIQYRSRAGQLVNLGASCPDDAKQQYKRMYFVDWVALNRHLADIADRVEIVVDDRCPGSPTFIQRTTLFDVLDDVASTVLRVVPWFEPGPWGGQWIKHNLPGLSLDVPNYAWSFELIVPENGLRFRDDRANVEVAFSWLMIRNHRELLGDSADWFGFEFPIRFDFLDTIDGGNLSLQCHPGPEYIREHFGETFTQDETYYILDCQPEAEVYLGFRAGVDLHAFRTALEKSLDENVPVDVRSFVHTETTKRHDLFLIPHGTIHCSGRGNLVLEISATPYIFTFKMYDWLRLDLAGKPRPLNIARAFENLNVERQEPHVSQELVSKPVVVDSGPDWSLMHLPTHPDHFYDVHRYEFDSEVSVDTVGSPHILMLVEGSQISIEVQGCMQSFNFAETFVVPAAATSYRLINRSTCRVKVVKAFIKPESAWPVWMRQRRVAR